jgi:hypothetical protein
MNLAENTADATLPNSSGEILVASSINALSRIIYAIHCYSETWESILRVRGASNLRHPSCNLCFAVAVEAAARGCQDIHGLGLRLAGFRTSAICGKTSDYDLLDFRHEQQATHSASMCFLVQVPCGNVHTQHVWYP